LFAVVFVNYAATSGVSQPSSFNTRFVEAGNLERRASGRIGRGVNPPPQLGQICSSVFATQSRQNVHSKVQIIAASDSAGRSRSQHSQLGLSSSIFLALRLTGEGFALPTVSPFYCTGWTATSTEVTRHCDSATRVRSNGLLGSPVKSSVVVVRCLAQLSHLVHHSQ
jgi:hypothetical protein